MNSTGNCATDHGWMHFEGYASLITLRGLLDALPDTKHVILDIGDLVDNGYIDAREPLCRRRREADHGEIRNLAPTVILAEGSKRWTPAGETRCPKPSADTLISEDGTGLLAHV